MTVETVTHETLHRELAHLERLVVTRMDAADKAMELARKEITMVPTDVDRRTLSMEKFFGQQIKTLEERINQQRVLLEKVEDTLNRRTTDLQTRMTENTGIAAGRIQISGPIWGIIGSVLTAILAAAFISLIDRQKEPSFPNNPPTQMEKAL